MDRSEPHHSSILKTRRYHLFWIASLLSNVGTWMQQVAQPWVMLTISHSSFLVGLDSFAMNAPGWLLTFWGGSLADRLDRKRIILIFQSIQFLAIIILVALFALGLLQPWMIILISLCVGATDSLSTPALQTIVPSIVAKEEISKSISLNSIQLNLSRTLGPAIAGIILVQFGAIACFGANAISFIPFFLSVYWIYPKQGFEKDLPDSSSSKLPLKDMVKDIFKEKGVRAQLTTTFITNLFCSPLITFCPVLVKEIFDGKIKYFGFASTSFGLGGLMGAVIAFFFFSKFRKNSPTYFGISLGFITIAVALNHSLIILLFLMLLAGAGLSLANTTANSNLQLQATNQVRGRYASLFQLVFRGGLSLGALVTGLCTSRFGIVAALSINGTLALVLHAILLFRGRTKYKGA